MGAITVRAEIAEEVDMFNDGVDGTDGSSIVVTSIDPGIVKAEIAALTEERDWYRAQAEALREEVAPLIEQCNAALPWLWTAGNPSLGESLAKAMAMVENVLEAPKADESEDDVLIPHLPGLVDAARNEAISLSGKTWQQELDGI